MTAAEFIAQYPHPKAMREASAAQGLAYWLPVEFHDLLVAISVEGIHTYASLFEHCVTSEDPVDAVRKAWLIINEAAERARR